MPPPGQTHETLIRSYDVLCCYVRGQRGRISSDYPVNGRVLVAQIIDAEDTTMWLQTLLGRMKIDEVTSSKYPRMVTKMSRPIPPFYFRLHDNTSDQENANVRDLVQATSTNAWNRCH